MSAAPVLLHPLQLVAAPPLEAWVSADAVLQLTGWQRRWMFSQAQQGILKSRQASVKLQNGRYAREYNVFSLPAAAQERYRAQQSSAATITGETLPLFPQAHRGLTLAGNPMPRVRLAPTAEPQADKHLAILQPILEMRARSGKRGPVALILPDGKPVDSLTRMVKFVAIHARINGKRVSERKVWALLKRYDEGGAADLARRQRSDAGTSRYFDQPKHQKAAALLAYLYLGDGIRPGHSAQACYEMLEAQRELVGLGPFDLPTDRTVRSFLGSISPVLTVYAQRGRKEFAERMMPFLSRGYQEFSNQIWTSDHSIMDVEVLNDCIPGAPQGMPVRLRLTAILDYRSRVLVGYSWAWEGTSASIATALRFAVTANGPCDNWYADNGQDYKAVAKGAVPGYLKRSSAVAEDWAAREMQRIEQTGVLARLGIQVTACLPYHPQSKHIERFFRTVHMTFCRLWQTYTGGTPAERPDQTTKLMAHTRRAIKRGEIETSHHPLASEFMERFAAWVKVYHGKRHGGQGMGHRSPAEVFAAHRNPTQRPTPQPEELAVLLAQHKSVRVHECQVQVNKTTYAPRTPLQAQLMFDRNETSVLVAHDPLDTSRIAVLDTGGHLVTMLESKILVRQAPDDPETQAQIAAMQQMRGRLTRGLRERHQQVIQAGKQLAVMTPLQLLTASSEDALIEPGRITPRKPGLATGPTLSTAPRSPRQVAAELFARQQKETA